MEIVKSSEFLKLQSQIEALAMYANETVITDLNSKKLASDNIGYLKKALKDIESKKLELTAPLRDTVSKFNNEVKLLSEPAELALKNLNSKFIKYTQEQERIAREEAEAQRRIDIARLEAEAKLKEQAMIDTAESIDDVTLLDEAIAQQAVDNARIEAIKAQEIIVKTNSTRGQAFSTGVRYLPRARVVDPKAFFSFVASSERFELVEIKESLLNPLAKTTLGTDTSQKITKNGIEFYYEPTTGSR